MSVNRKTKKMVVIPEEEYQSLTKKIQTGTKHNCITNTKEDVIKPDENRGVTMSPSHVITNKKKRKREKDPPPVPGVRKSPKIRKKNNPPVVSGKWITF